MIISKDNTPNAYKHLPNTPACSRTDFRVATLDEKVYDNFGTDRIYIYELETQSSRAWGAISLAYLPAEVRKALSATNLEKDVINLDMLPVFDSKNYLYLGATRYQDGVRLEFEITNVIGQVYHPILKQWVEILQDDTEDKLAIAMSKYTQMSDPSMLEGRRLQAAESTEEENSGTSSSTA